MNKLRDAAGLFVGFGRTIGEAEAIERISQHPELLKDARQVASQVAALRQRAEQARLQAEALLCELDPAPPLLQRVRSAWEAATTAWRSHRPRKAQTR
jgi:hypothetical protein